MDLIKAGKLPFIEPGLDTALISNINKSFFVTNDVEASVKKSDFIFLCVGTPSGEYGEADLKFIYSVIDMFSPALNDSKYRVIVIKSTIPPSTTSEKIIPYMELKGLEPIHKLGVANNPEFLREGHCWDDMMNADRIVCGVSDRVTENMLHLLYSSFNASFFSVTLNTGEFIKYLSNTLLATMISFSNEMSKIAEVIGDVQIKKAFEILHLDKRWNGASMSSYVYPGVGYGGYCLPKDTQAMYVASLSRGFEPRILKNVIETNNSMPQFMVNKIMSSAKKSDKIGILGLSFKPGSDDVRESSAAKIISLLIEAGYQNISAYDPWAKEAFANQYNFEKLIFFENLQQICDSSDVLVIVTAWEEFVGIDKSYLSKVIIDCRYFL